MVVCDAGYFEHFNLTAPKELAKWDAKLGGDPFPAKRGQVSEQWSQSSTKEISWLTGQICHASGSHDALAFMPVLLQYHVGCLFLTLFLRALGALLLRPTVNCASDRWRLGWKDV